MSDLLPSFKHTSDIKLLMVVPKYPFPIVGGLEKQSHELSKSLIQNNIDVKVLSGKIFSSQSDSEVVDGVKIYRVSWPKNQLIRYFKLPFSLFFYLFRNRNCYNIVHVHTLGWFSLYVIILSKILGKPVITKLANVGDYGLPGVSKLFLGNLMIKILMLSESLVSMSNESTYEAVDKGYAQKNIFMTVNGISLNTIENNNNNNSLCKVVFVGRLHEQKDFTSLFKAWKLIQENSKVEAVLHIWGEGLLDVTLKSLVNELEISKSVVFSGHVDNVDQKLHEMDVFVLPSFAEGNSNAILEGMAAGLPIVSTDVGGTVIQVGLEGKDFISKAGDTMTFYKNLLRLVENRSLRQTVGLAMRIRIEEHFDIDKVSKDYIKAYQKILSNDVNNISALNSNLFK